MPKTGTVPLRDGSKDEIKEGRRKGRGQSAVNFWSLSAISLDETFLSWKGRKGNGKEGGGRTFALH